MSPLNDLFSCWFNHLNNELMSLPFPETCKFLASSAPPSIRSRLLAWVLQEYATELTPEFLDGPLRSIFQIGFQLWGGSLHSGWRQCAPEITQAVRWIENADILRTFLDEERFLWWRSYLPSISRIGDANGILLIDCGVWVAAEKKEPGQSCGWYRRDRVSLPLKEPDEVWRRGEFWPDLFQRRMLEILSVRTDKD